MFTILNSSLSIFLVLRAATSALVVFIPSYTEILLNAFLIIDRLPKTCASYGVGATIKTQN